MPVLAAYVQSHPELKAIGTQHGGITSVLAEVLTKAGKRPGEIIVGGIDLAPATIDGLQSGYVNVTLDQLLYLQGFLPVIYLYLNKLSGGVVLPPETNTGLVFLDSASAGLFLNTESRFEGDSDEQKIVEAVEGAPTGTAPAGTAPATTGA